jgi:hypothetical protein
MFNPFLRGVIKIVLASLVVGTILAHFGITVDRMMSELGLTAEQIENYARRGIAWALPNLMLGALVIVPVWFVIFLFRPPGARRMD